MNKCLIAISFLAALLASLPSSSLLAKARKPEPSKRIKKVSMPIGDEISVHAGRVKLPLYVYGNETGGLDAFSASGYMGDSNAIQSVTSKYDATAPASTGRTGKTSLRIRYRPKGRAGWAGLYWLTPANNWGRIKGAGYDLSQADRLTFWIRGSKGGERISQVKVGGINGPYPDSDEASLGPLVLSQDWEQYTIPLKDKDLSHIVGGFAIIFRRQDNVRGATIYLDGIIYEGKEESDQKMVQASKPKKQVDLSRLKEPVHRTVLFSGSKKGFSDNALKTLNEILDLAKKYKSSRVQLEGHTDNIGPADINKKLSEERAKSVADYFKKSGIKEDRISIQGFGEDKPVSPNNTKEGRDKNRRVEIVLQPS